MDNTIDVMIKTKYDGGGVKEATKDTKEYGDKLDSTSEVADTTETRLIGVHDVVDGVATVMQGPGKQGMVSYIQGWADVAGGVANTLPLLKALSISTLKAGAAQVKAGAQTVASWVAARATSAAAAAQMAAAWLVSLGPIAIVIATLAALGVAFVLLWKKSETFRDVVKGTASEVAGAFHWLYDKVIHPIAAAILGAINFIISGVRKLTAPFSATFHAVASAIEIGTAALRGFLGLSQQLTNIGSDVVNIVRSTTAATHPGQRGKAFAHGGITPGGRILAGERGAEFLDVPAGARVRSNADSGGAGGGNITVTLVLQGDDSAAGRFIDSMIRRSVARTGGGNVQLAYGNGVR